MFVVISYNYKWVSVNPWFSFLMLLNLLEIKHVLDSSSNIHNNPNPSLLFCVQICLPLVLSHLFYVCWWPGVLSLTLEDNFVKVERKKDIIVKEKGHICNTDERKDIFVNTKKERTYL